MLWSKFKYHYLIYPEYVIHTVPFTQYEVESPKQTLIKKSLNVFFFAHLV